LWGRPCVHSGARADSRHDPAPGGGQYADARPEETRLLRLRPGVPVLDVWHTSLDQDGQPYELTRFVMRGDMTGLLYDVPVE
jgi:UTRA domain